MKPYYETDNGKLYNGDSLEVLRGIEGGAPHSGEHSSGLPELQYQKRKSAYSFDRKTATQGKPGSPDQHRPDREYKEYIGTRNKRTVWTIATAPFSAAHFATFPPKLIEPCILAGTSEKGCCAACGAPYERQTESTKTFESGSGRSGNPITGKQNLTASETNSTPDIRMGPTISTKTIGWQPTCQDRVETRPCTVLDPFMGAGTVALVSEQYGRRWIGIELSPEYCRLIKNRIEPLTRQRRLF